LIVHHPAWVLPIAAPPIRDGWVAVHERQIVAVGGPADPPPSSASSPSRSGASNEAILPGLVNAHVHLELSWMQGAVPPARSMPAWASNLMQRRRAAREQPPVSSRTLLDARSSGTCLVGDVTNTLATYDALAASPLSAAVFFEQLGFRTDDARARAAEAQARIDALTPTPGLRASVVPHAPYSVSPALLRAIGDVNRGALSIHLGESPEEAQFLADGTGAWRTLLEELGVWDDRWVPPRCGPVEYIARAGLLSERLLAVHCTHLTDEELSRLAGADATVVTCPRSNVWTGAGIPPIQRFYDSGVRVAVGTDSLASVDDLNVFTELAAMRAAAPGVPPARLLESATRKGAEALGFGAELGTIAAGRRGELIAVRVPAGVGDVEEYLVGGIQPADVRWLEG
jgi:cytosine/adenosine deaminase-related metal-dependent hydrolase